MKPTTFFCLSAVLCLAGFVSACSNTDPGTIQPFPTGQTVPDPATATHTFAPACPADPACSAPDVKDTEAIYDTYCVDKIPYQNISVEPGTQFEPLEANSDLHCYDTGTVDKNGKNVWTCTSRQLWKYQLKISNPACQTRNLVPYSENCQAGLGYDAANNCCAPMDGSESGFKIITVNMGACPTP